MDSGSRIDAIVEVHGETMVVLAMSFRTFLMCLNSCTKFISS
jgi:hypothetical protein